jgi:hypothetical protein
MHFNQWNEVKQHNALGERFDNINTELLGDRFLGDRN